MKKNNKFIIIWIGKNIFDKKNESNSNKSEKNFYIQTSSSERVMKNNKIRSEYDLKFYKRINEAIDFIKKLRFNDTIIVVNGDMLDNFISEFKNNINEIYVIPKIIIFKKEEGFLLSLFHKILKFLCFCRKKQIIEKFYCSEQIYSSFDDIISYFDYLIKEKKFYDDKYKINNKNKIFLKDVKYIFDPVRNKKDLILPLFYNILLDISETKKNNAFIKSMYQEYSNNSKYNKLLKQILNITVDIPLELLSKYYARMYTFEGDFYKKMKDALLSDNNEDNVFYQPYIKTLYEGARSGALKSFIGKKLYSAQLLSDKEIQELMNYKKNRKANLPMSIIFSKAFISFSKSKEVAEKFFRYGKNTFLTIEDAKREYYLFTHADIEELSIYQNEKEVLFFPFSSFGIDDIEYNEKDKRYEIKLIYLGRYIKNFENDKSFDVSNDVLPNSRFKSMFKKSGLIEKDKINNLKIKDISHEFKQYKERNTKKLSCLHRIVIFIIIFLILLIALFIIISSKEPKEYSKCLGGTYYDFISKECLPCKAGYFSKNGARKCSRCSNGYTSNCNSSFCFSCPAGTYSNNNVENCTLCRAGYYSKEGAASCTKCPGGTYSKNGAKECIKCKEGYYSKQGSENCLKCEAGTYSKEGAGNCVNCPDGTYTNISGANSCLSCKASMTSNKNKTSCVSCEKGYYSNKTGSPFCNKCPKGTFTNITGSTFCNICPKGTYSNSVMKIVFIVLKVIIQMILAHQNAKNAQVVLILILPEQQHV